MISPDIIENSALLPASPSRVWRALTDHVEFGEWFRVKLDAPFQPGKLSIGHITYPGYEHLKWEAIVQRMEPEKFFVFTWHPYAIEPTVDYSVEIPTSVTFALEPKETGCLLTVSESGFDKIPEQRRVEAFEMNREGWKIQMENITEHLRKNP